MVVLLMPVLAGMLGLVIDGGLLLGAYRQTQNAADAAAMAAALDKMRGSSDGTALFTANRYVHEFNGLADAPDLVPGQTFNIPPKQGPYAGNPQYVEVIVSYPVNTTFMSVLGFDSQTVTARAVAGFEAVSAGQGIVTLDPTAAPGLSVNGGTTTVNGSVLVNAEATSAPFAAAVNGAALLRATSVDVVGDVNNPNGFQNVPPNTGSPLHTGVLPGPDPLLKLPTPASYNGVDTTDRGSADISDGTTTLDPGVYSSIKITGGTVTLNPGIYVVKGELTITGSANVQGNGVMFYATGTDYNPNFGFPDVNDGNGFGTDPNATYGAVTISAANVNLQPYNQAGSPFNGMLLYQRRWNDQPMTIQGSAGPNFNLGGTLYAKWAPLSLTGQGQFNVQLVAGRVNVTATGGLTIDYTGRLLGQAYAVFLVE
jgi:hypothetical protein